MGVGASTHATKIEEHDKLVETHQARAGQRSKELEIKKQVTRAKHTALRATIDQLLTKQEAHKDDWKEMYTMYAEAKKGKEEKEQLLLRKVRAGMWILITKEGGGA